MTVTTHSVPVVQNAVSKWEPMHEMGQLKELEIELSGNSVQRFPRL